MPFLDGHSSWWRHTACSRAGPTCIVQPLLQQWLELAHVLEAQVKGLEAGDGGLAEVIPIQLPHGQAHVTLLDRNVRVTTTLQLY